MEISVWIQTDNSGVSTQLCPKLTLDLKGVSEHLLNIKMETFKSNG